MKVTLKQVHEGNNISSKLNLVSANYKFYTILI